MSATASLASYSCVRYNTNGTIHLAQAGAASACLAVAGPQVVALAKQAWGLGANQKVLPGRVMSGHSDVQLGCKREQQSLGVLRVWGEGPVGYPACFACHHRHLQGDQLIGMLQRLRVQTDRGRGFRQEARGGGIHRRPRQGGGGLQEEARDFTKGGGGGEMFARCDTTWSSALLSRLNLGHL